MDSASLERYDYILPEKLIRREGVEPRDAARLFVYDTATDTVTYDLFRHLADYLPEGTLAVLNDTRVVPARLALKKETGGKIEVFVLMNEYAGQGLVPAITDRKVSVGQRLWFPDGSRFTVREQTGNRFFLELASETTLSSLLDRYGTTPIPHYLEGGQSEEAALRKRYQTVFAEAGTSVAAPTASLHFTEAVFASLRKKRIDTVPLRLDVGLGTFAPLVAENFETGRLHRERFAIPERTAQAITAARHDHRRILAVGTTVMRVLESAVAGTGMIPAGEGETDIFIRPPHRFRTPDTLLTNFHLPRSSLMLLVQAFLEDKQAKRSLISLYEEAIRARFAFYSFGDSMLIR